MHSEFSIELAARLSLLEKLMSDQLLDRIYYNEEPLQELDRVRKRTILALEQSTAPPDIRPDQVDIVMHVQTKMLGFAERFFDRIESDLRNLLEED